jgi:hypothetical protein
MREEVEGGREGEFAPEWGSGPRSLRLLQPWTRAASPDGRGTPSRIEDLTWPTSQRRHLALADVDEQHPERPSAMVVMGQLLEAWRSAERQLAATAEGGAERSRLQVQIATLRALYQGLFTRVQSRGPIGEG